MTIKQSVIEVSCLGKSFKRYARIRHRLLEWLPGKRVLHTAFPVLQNITFSVKPGESIGIIGRNGAGKSTLLKLLTGTLLPTSGHLFIQGRIAALLELGMGFHPDFSGWDNAVMAGQLQGLSQAQILDCMDDIIEFAEIGDAIQQPVRTYSSGMVVRLAFAVATAVRPDVLIVDEALAVGDAYFQHKCFRRIKEFREQGVTLLFVSHDPLAVKSLCNRALLIEQGRVVLDADPISVLDYYNALIAVEEARYQELHGGITQDQGTRSGTGEVRVACVELNKNGVPSSHVLEGDPIQLRVAAVVHDEVDDLTIGIMFKDRLGNDVFGVNTYQLGLTSTLKTILPGTKISLLLEISDFHLAPGAYSLTVACHGGNSHLVGNYDWWDQVLTVHVGPGVRVPFAGVTRLPIVARLETGVG